MTNNDTLRRLRYAFSLSDSQMIAIFALADFKTNREQVSNWLKKDDDDAYVECEDVELAAFLNGFINEKRGKKDGPQIKPETRLTHNLVFKKLKIALNLKSEGILDILELADFNLSEHELSSFFRKPGNKHYRVCKDQIMRNFLKGVQIKYRKDDSSDKSSESISDNSDQSNSGATTESNPVYNAVPKSDK